MNEELLPAEAEKREIQIQQAQALSVLAKGVSDIATFLTSGGLTELMSGYARSQAVKDILGGLAAHDGRNALDARVLGQNALEIVEQVEKVFSKYEERLSSKNRDPELHNAEDAFIKWKEEKKGD